MLAPSPIQQVMTAAVRKAAKKLQRDYGEVEHLQVSRKGPGDFVTAADKRVEAILIEELTRARPAFSFLTEESGEIPGKDPTQRWIIDPIDGTKNFMHAVPYFCISVALEKIHDNGKREVQAGLIYNPITDEMFWAEKGGGAWLNARRLRVSARSTLEEALLATGAPIHTRKRYEQASAMFRTMTNRAFGVRCPGAGALDLAYVAAGKFDGFWCNELAAWDMAAGILLVLEAGGMVSEIGGGGDMLTNGNILACNSALHQTVASTLKECL